MPPPGIRISYQGGSAGMNKISCRLSHRFYRVLGKVLLWKFRPLPHYSHKILLLTHHNHLPKPFGPGTVQAFIGVRPPGVLLPCQRGPARFFRLLCPLLTSPMRSGPVTRPSDNPAHGRSPGVNTCLSVPECRIYGHTL